MIRVALSTIPPRFAGLGPVLDSLLAQGADAVLLSIPHGYTRFPDWDGTLPDLPPGVTLLRPEDRRAATKFIEPCRRFPDDRLVIADDDCLYGPGWLDALKGPGIRAASTFDGGRIAAPGATIVQGFAGIAFAPSDLPADLTDPPSAFDLVDDIWLSAMIALAGHPITLAPHARAAVTPFKAPASLQSDTPRDALNRAAVTKIRDTFALWT